MSLVRVKRSTGHKYQVHLDEKERCTNLDVGTLTPTSNFYYRE